MNSNRIHVKARTWEYDTPFSFPEDKEAQGLSGKSNTGIALSGGGNRSATLAAGYLRALVRAGHLGNIKYISAVSGGSWAATPFTFLDRSIGDEAFLGEYLPPEKITMASLRTAHKRSLIGAVSDTVLMDDYLQGILRFKNDEKFAHILNALYLKPFLLGDQGNFFTWNKENVLGIVDRQGNEELRAEDFYTVRPDRPYLIVGAILSRSFLAKIRRYPFEITPLYCGMAPYCKNEGSLGKFDLGGGYLETFAFDSDSPDEESLPAGEVRVRIRRKINRFSLADMIAASGAALGEHLDRFGLEVGFPEFKYWSPRNPEKAKEYDFADGGLLDNLGIMPLLRRKVERIICFVNTDSDLSSNAEVSTMIKALFMRIDNHFGIKDFDGNIVLKEQGKADGRASYESVRDELRRLNRHGKPAVLRKAYVTLDNTLYGIEPGHEVEILWVHNALVQEWVERLDDPDVKEYVLEERQKRDFPNLSTFLTNFPRIIDLTVEQANLMAHHAAYTVESSSGIFSEFLG